MLKYNDWVKIKYGEYEGRYGRVASRKKSGEYCLVLYDDAALKTSEKETGEAGAGQPGSMLSLNEDALELMPPYLLSQKELRKLVRAEHSYSDFAEHIFPPFNLKTERRYTLKIEDIKEALTNINKNKPPLELFKQWFWLILNVFYDDLNIKKRYDESIFTDFPKDEKEIFSTVFGLTEKLYWRLEERLGSREETEQYLIRFQNEPIWEKDGEGLDEIEITAYFAICREITGRIDSYLFNQGKSQGKWIYSPAQMRHVIGSYETDEDLKDATPEALALYRDFVRRLYRVGDVQAIRILAFGYMDGGIAYRQNFELARIYMQELFDRTGDPSAANALGYIYYYGLTNNGIPQYDKAFSMFSYGVMDGIDESVYMAAQMLIRGQGTVKNIDMGLNLLVDGYRNCLYDFCREIYDCRFAEFAMHMGDCCLDRVIYSMGVKDAYRFYLEAQFAAEKRREIGEPLTAENEEKIERTLSYIRDRVGLDPKANSLKADFPMFINQMYEDRYPVRVLISENKETKEVVLKIRKFDLSDLFRHLHISLEELEHGGAEMSSKILTTYPELSWCGLVSEMEYTLENGTVLKVPERKGPFLSDGFRRDDATNVLEFYAHGEVIAAVEADWYTIKVKHPN